MTQPDPPSTEQLNDDDEPKTAYVRRIARRGDWIFGGVFLVALPCTFTVGVAITPERTGWILVTIPAAWFAATYLGHFAQLGYVWGKRRRLEARNWNLCGSCGYDTTGTGLAGTCPECGNVFSTEHLREDFLLYQRRVKHMRMLPRVLSRVR